MENVTTTKSETRRQVAFTTNKHGQPVAYRWGGYVSGGRWFRTGYDDAKVAVATGAAREVPFVSARTVMAGA